MADDARGRAVHVLSLVRSVIPPLHRGGLPIIGAVGVGTLVARKLLRMVGLRSASTLVGRAGMATTIASAAFFRAPVRVSPQAPGVVVAPADGLVSLIELAPPPADSGWGRNHGCGCRSSCRCSTSTSSGSRCPVW